MTLRILPALVPMMLVALASPLSVFALGSTFCSSANGALQYSSTSANRGIPPRDGDWMATTLWTYQGKTLLEITQRYGQDTVTAGPGVDWSYDEATRKVTAEDGRRPFPYHRVSTVRAHVTAKDGSVDFEGYLLCEESVPPPAP